MAERRAYRIKRLSRLTGEAWLYRVDPPVEYGWEEDSQNTEYVVSSATISLFVESETYLLPADESGEIIEWGKLDGSFRGSWDCDQAVRNAGYTIVEQGADSEG